MAVKNATFYAIGGPFLSIIKTEWIKCGNRQLKFHVKKPYHQQCGFGLDVARHTSDPK